MSALTQMIIGYVVIAICAAGGAYGGYLFYSAKKNSKKHPEVTEITKESNVFNKLPLFDFSIEKKAQDPADRYYDEVLFITNKGEGPAINVSIFKFPLPDNKQKRAVSGFPQRVNNNMSKTLSIVGINDRYFVLRERGYAGKNVRITVRFKNIFNCLFEFIYEGELNKLHLVKRSFLNKETGKKEAF